MASQKQIEANRANAKKSTGPKTVAGKLRSRQNAWKHGLSAEVIVALGENPEAFDELRSELMLQHSPQGSLECELVDRIAGLLWRLRRATVFEAAILDYHQAMIAYEEVMHEPREREMRAVESVATLMRKERWGAEGIQSEAVYENQERLDEGSILFARSARLGCVLHDDAVNGNALGKLGRHETTLMNNLAKTLKMLLDLQSSRRQTEAAAAEEDDEEPLTPTRRAA